jgi:hypothetical protein
MHADLKRYWIGDHSSPSGFSRAPKRKHIGF